MLCREEIIDYIKELDKKKSQLDENHKEHRELKVKIDLNHSYLQRIDLLMKGPPPE